MKTYVCSNFASNINSQSKCFLQVKWYQAVRIAEGIYIYIYVMQMCNIVMLYN